MYLLPPPLGLLGFPKVHTKEVTYYQPFKMIIATRLYIESGALVYSILFIMVT